MKLETKLTELLKPLGNGPFTITAYELTRYDGQWSVNTPFNIGSNLDLSECLSRLRSRWEVFKANYASKASVQSLRDIGDADGPVELEADYIPFALVTREEA